MKKPFPQEFNSALLIAFLGVIIVGAIFTGIILLGFYSPTEDTSTVKSGNKTKLTTDNVETGDWEMIPYFSEDVNFLASYPSEWQEIAVADPRSLYEGQYLVWFADNRDYYEGTNTLAVFYYLDSGDSFDVWTGKRQEFLTDERGYEPEVKKLTKDGENFVQMCFLGDPDHSPMKKCHIFFHRAPYIYELRAEGYSRDWQADIYMGEFFSRFELFGEVGEREDWLTKDSYNGGYSIMYPEKYLSPYDQTEFRLVIADSSKDIVDIYEGENMILLVTTGYADGAIQYWYDRNKDYLNTTVSVPKEIVVNNQSCIFVKPTLQDDVVDFYSSAEIICKYGSRIYDFQMRTNVKGVIDPVFLEIISTTRFSIDYVKDDAINNYKDEKARFELDYVNTLLVNESGMEDNYNWIGFDVETDDYYPWKHYGVEYYKTDLSVEDCDTITDCLLDFESLSEFSKSKFLGLDAYVLEREDEYDGINSLETVTLFKKGDYIYRIRSVIDQDGENTEIENIINSFKFL